MSRVLLLAKIGLLLFPASAFASCIQMTPAQQAERADVIFDGIALEGPTSTGVQRFRVERYLKGSGTAAVGVTTGVTRRSDGTGSITSVSIEVAAGERWRIYGGRLSGSAVTTSSCDGSRKLAGSGSGPSVPAAEEARGSWGRRAWVTGATLVLLTAAGLALARFGPLRRRKAPPLPR